MTFPYQYELSENQLLNEGVETSPTLVDNFPTCVGQTSSVEIIVKFYMKTFFGKLAVILTIK